MTDSYALCYVMGPVLPGLTGRPPGCWVVDTYPNAQEGRDALCEIVKGAAVSTGAPERIGRYIANANALSVGETDRAVIEGYTYVVVRDQQVTADGFAHSSAPNVVTAAG